MKQENAIVEMRGLSKGFGRTQALAGVDLTVARGTIIGLLGANGAGKSTLLRHMIGLYLADTGTCTTFGVDAAKLGPAELGRIGYVHQEGELLEWMTVAQLIRYVAAYYANWNSDLEARYIADFGIETDKRVGTLSPGQRQKVAILLAIGFEPELLLLDEPASALDPIARARFLDLLLHIIQDANRTIIISSHILSDVEKVIDHTVIMRDGRIVCDCAFDALRERFTRITITSLNGPLPASLGFDNMISCQRNDTRAVLTVKDVPQETLTARAKDLHCEIEIKALTLEEIYAAIAG